MGDNGVPAGALAAPDAHLRYRPPMLSYLSRTLPQLVRARMGQDGRLVSQIRRRASLARIDINMHLNQAAYAEVMELGRVDWVVRSGAWDAWRAAGVNPVVARQEITYRRELKPLAPFTVDTRATGLEGRLLRVEHHLVRDGRVHARGDLRLLFVGPDGVLEAAAVADLASGVLTAPLPVADWRVQTG